MVSCDHTGNIQIKPLTGNGETYYAFIVMDHVIGVKGASYSLDSGASYIELTRTEYNAFVVEANTIPSTFKLKITSIANEDLIVDINSYTDTIDTQQQFTIPNSFFDIQTLEETTKPSNLDICCPAPDDVTVIYDDLVRGIWTISSSATLDSTSSPYSGSYCINIDIPQWSVMQFDADYYLDLDLYTAVSFYVKTNQAGTNCFEVKKMSGSSNIGTYVSIESANTWQYVELTFEELGVTTGEDFKCFEIQNRLSSPTNYYFDDVKLIRSSVSTRVCADGTVSTESSSSEEVIESSSSEEVIESSSSEVATESSSSEILIESSSSEVVTESSSSEEGESSSDPIISSGEKEESSSHGQSSEGESENIISESNSSNELDDGAKRSGIAGMIFGVLVYCLLM